MTLERDVVFIGAGNMASALIEGLVSSQTCRPQRITASDPDAERLAQLASRLGIATTADNVRAARGAQVLVLATKPQMFGQVLPALRQALDRDPLILSVAAGVPLSVIEAQLGGERRVVRAMPNTPALVGKGATAMAAGTRASEADLAVAEQVFSSVGLVVRVPETLMDAVTGLSGSGPAYVFAMVEALTHAGQQVGLPAETAAQLARQTVIGAAHLLEQSGQPPEVLRKQVTSPGGTTQAGLERLAERDYEGVIRDAVARATARSAELGAEAKKPT